MSLKKLPYFLLYALFCLSCAKQSVPSGGPKDTIPPKLISTIPPQNQLNFKGKELSFTFSENIAIVNPKEQIIIAPSINKEFDAVAKNKVVTFTFERDLSDTTTYSINFRDAVKDVTEKNAVVNLKFAFSTGPYIDSLSIDGTTSDLLRDKPLKDITIALYQNSDTFLIFKHKPVYMTKTNEAGAFKLENLKNGLYYIYAFDDKNRNLIVDSKNESYAFLADTLRLAKNITKLKLTLVRLDARPLKITSAKPYSNYFNIRVSKSLTNYNLKVDPDTTTAISCFGDDNSNVRIYNTFPTTLDSIKVKFHASDSIQNQVDSTLYIKFSKKEPKLEKFDMTLDPVTVSDKTGNFQTKIIFNKPIATINFDSIFFRPDSVTIVPFTDQDITWDFDTNTATITKKLDKKYFTLEPTAQSPQKQPLKKGKRSITNLLYLGRSAFISIDRDTSKAATVDTKVLRDEDTGIIRITIKTSEPNFVCQLLTADFKVVNSTANKTQFQFQNIKPGEYSIRLIADKNGNGKWDPGNFNTRTEPEPVTFYHNEKNKDTKISVKANWDIGPLLITFP